MGLLLDSSLIVQEVVPNGPAAASGVIAPGDSIVSVAGVDVVGKAPGEVLCYFLGPPGAHPHAQSSRVL